VSHPRGRPAPDASRFTIPPGHPWNRLPLLGLVLGGIGLLASLALGARDPEQFYFSWLVAFTFFLSIALGGLFFVLLHYVTGARWSVVVRRLSENAMATLPVFVVLFLPVALGVHRLYHWAHADAAAHDPLLAHKSSYLNPGFFFVRAALCLGIWTLFALWFYRRSLEQDRTGDAGIARRLRQLSAPGMIVFALTITIAAVDWIMSLEPHWYSTIFGVYFFTGSLVGIFAFLSIVAVLLTRTGLLQDALTTEHFHDLGKLLSAFTTFWAYIGFSQYFLIWYANIPEETVFYQARLAGSWRAVTIALAVGHFGVPFFFLMSRNVKRRRPLLLAGAVWMLLMHLLDVHWLVMPTLHEEGFRPHLLDLTALAAVGGLFLALFGQLARRHALLPTRDPHLLDSMRFENA
jgi:hypothetical protein